jgi:hypothetical protein
MAASTGGPELWQGEGAPRDCTDGAPVQIHPDAASFEHHLRVLAGVDESYRDTLEATTAIRIYGTPTEEILAILHKSVGSHILITVLPTHLGGFTRGSG